MKSVISTEKAPEAIGAYSQAVEIDNFLFLSGQLPMNPINGKIIEGNIEEQAKQVLENIKAILEEANVKMNSIVKATVYLNSMDNFAKVNKVYKSYFSGDLLPARAVVEVSQLPKEVSIEIEIIAHK